MGEAINPKDLKPYIVRMNAQGYHENTCIAWNTSAAAALSAAMGRLPDSFDQGVLIAARPATPDQCVEHPVMNTLEAQLRRI